MSGAPLAEILAAGGCVVIADFNDPHQQEFLRGHDDDISSLSVSPSGNLIASGQQGTNSDVIIWDYASRQIKFRFSEHDHGVNTVAFSHDERLLITIGCKDDSKMIVWDLTTGNIVATKGGIDDHLACWGGMSKDINFHDTDKYLFATAGGMPTPTLLASVLVGRTVKYAIFGALALAAPGLLPAQLTRAVSGGSRAAQAGGEDIKSQ